MVMNRMANFSHQNKTNRAYWKKRKHMCSLGVTGTQMFECSFTKDGISYNANLIDNGIVRWEILFILNYLITNFT